ncbi:MAG: hypothetical protein COW85_12910 [Ignavibacteria bacterium CG22_combo_CG10-13_8_21_14_all_37_15]|nr:MAG: hypothetical protein COW85_12910 [Ignavibacteria bacterium CG22_combo_CG10-13_8_21_14_all_37_15]
MNGGLAKLNTSLSEWSVYNLFNSGLIDNDVYSVNIDKFGKVWCGTSSGLAVFTPGNPTAIDRTDNPLSPKDFLLYQNYPNPFNPSTTINYQIPSNSFVTLKVYDLLGNEITTLVNEEKAAGAYQVNFSAQQTTNNKPLASGMSSKGGYASGVYFYTLTAGKFTATKKFILMK